MVDSYLVPLLLKLGVIASIASFLARSSRFKAMLMLNDRTLQQRLILSLWLGIPFAAGVAMRVVAPAYVAADLSLEGAMLAGILGGYVTGLLSGVLIALPALLVGGEHLAMPVIAGVGVFGGLLRDIAPDAESIWDVSPLPDLNIYRFFKESREYRRAAFPLLLIAAILTAEAVRQMLGFRFANDTHKELFYLMPPHPGLPMMVAVYACTLFAVAIPLKIWHNTRNEKKLEEQGRLLVEARLAALTSQINPHFLFNTLNSVSSLIRTDPNQARVMLLKLSKVLRRLLRKNENFSTLRDELSFIADYLSIEVVRFGEKLRSEQDIAPDTLDLLVPSMMLQPLVENSIKHGLSSKVEGGTIRIRTRRAEGKLQITVEDDGVGIPEAKLATVLDHGIGVSNVNERLKVLFANDYRMWIDSPPGEGTRIQIEMPELQTEMAAVS